MKTKMKRARTVVAAAILCISLLGGFTVHGAVLAPIQSEEDLRNAFFDGGDYILQNDFTLSNTLLLSNTHESGIFTSSDITIDFNGYTISSAESAIEIRGYGENGKGNITLLDRKNSGGIHTSSQSSAPIKCTGDQKDYYINTLTIQGGIYEGSRAGLYIADFIKANVQIYKGTFTFQETTGLPVYGSPVFNNNAVLSTDGKTLTVGPDAAPVTTTSPVTDQQPSIESTTVIDSTDNTSKRQTAVVDVNTDIPGASYTITIPATISFPVLDRAEETADDKLSTTSFSVSIDNIKNFYREKSVEVILNSDCILINQNDETDALGYSIMKDGSAYNGGALFAELNENQTEQTGQIVIDRSTIRKSGNYHSVIEFNIALSE